MPDESFVTVPGSRRYATADTTPSGHLDTAARVQITLVAAPYGGRTVEYRHREGELRMPAELADVVLAVLGLDDRPQARTRHRVAAAAAGQVSYTPPQLGTIYKFPDGTDGTGQTVAI